MAIDKLVIEKASNETDFAVRFFWACDTASGHDSGLQVFYDDYALMDWFISSFLEYDDDDEKRHLYIRLMEKLNDRMKSE